MNILEELDSFSFALIPCSCGSLAHAIKQQGAIWGSEYAKDDHCLRDIRIIYYSPDGPNAMPATNIGILLSETKTKDGPITLFVSSVRDGYYSMLLAISRTITGKITSFRVSKMDIRYPGAFIQSFVSGVSPRTVYSMKDEKEWTFWEKGSPLEFEEPGRYLARQKKDRLNLNIISIYLQKLGYISLEREFWINDHEEARLLAYKGFRAWRAPERNL